MRLRDFCGIAALQSALLTFLLWLEVGRSFGRWDAFVGLCTGVAVTIGVGAARNLKASEKLHFSLPSSRLLRFLASFAINSLLFIAILSIPIVEARILHPLNSGGHSLRWLLGFGLWMGFWFAITGFGSLRKLISATGK